MAKPKKQFRCENCSNITSRWQGKCDNCREWNTIAEHKSASSTASGSVSGTAGNVIGVSEVKNIANHRYSTGISEFDEVLGGGLVAGSMVLLGGDPGIGKSTIALQFANMLQAQQKNVLYVSGEESAQQIKMRHKRLAGSEDIQLLTETNLETIVATLEMGQFNVAVIDSIQTIQSTEVGGVVGGVAQLSYITNTLLRVAKARGISIVLIGHVTKEGMLAGPKTIEHMVDVVLYLEGERYGQLRLLRSSKNRFGSVGEVGVFEMRDTGLHEILNPSALFLDEKDEPLPGSSITAILEGNKVLMLEVQALTSTTSFGYPKRTTSGFDANRLQLIIAILEKNLKVKLNNQDIYVNVAGGFKIDDRSADLPVALAILSSYYGVPLPEGLVSFGEIGLLGEVRASSHVDKRLKEAAKLKFKNVVTAGKASRVPKRLSVASVKTIHDVKKIIKK